MKILLLLTLFISFGDNSTYAQNNPDEKFMKNLVPPNDTILIRTINPNLIVDFEKDSLILINDETSDLTPSVIIGIISVLLNIGLIVNNYLSVNKQLKATEDNLNKQLNATDINLNKQLKASEQNLLTEIDHQKNIQKAEYKSNLAINNQQNWINEIRDCISKFLSLSTISQVRQTFENSEAIIFNKEKLSLLLDTNAPSQLEILNNINQLYSLLYDRDRKNFHSAKKKLVTNSLIFFKEETDKINNFELTL